jgi:hypothetical protein
VLDGRGRRDGGEAGRYVLTTREGHA